MLVAALVIISLFFSGVSSADGVCETGCRNLVLPSTECSTAFNPLLIMFQNGITRALNPDTVDCNRDTAARFLEQQRECSGYCYISFALDMQMAPSVLSGRYLKSLREPRQFHCDRM